MSASSIAPFDGKVYRRCHGRHTSSSRGCYIGRTLGLATLICFLCHNFYYMDSNGNEITDLVEYAKAQEAKK